LKILVVAPQPFLEERGTPLDTHRLVNTLASSGHSVDLLTYPLGRNAPDTKARVMRSGGLPGIHSVPVGPSWQKLALDIPFTLKFATLARPGAYDVVHAVEEAIFPALALARRHRARVVYDMDSSLAEQLTDSGSLLRLLGRPIRALERWALRRSDLILPVCDDLVNLAAEVVGSADRIRVLRDIPLEPNPTGEPVDDLRALWPPGATVALYVGNLISYQGIDLLVGAAERLSANSDIGIVVIGGSEANVTAYRQRTARLGLGDRLTFLGPRPVGDLSAYLEQADILVSPRSKGGNTPLKIYSYMAAGKAILATRISSHTQVLDESTAYLCHASPQDLAGGLERLAADPAVRQQLGKAAQELVEREYTAEIFDAALIDAYKRFTDV
jgi:glycosyltransferase involved in cell wall biosynthesis